MGQFIMGRLPRRTHVGAYVIHVAPAFDFLCKLHTFIKGIPIRYKLIHT